MSNLQLVGVAERTLRPFLEGNHDDWLRNAGLTEFAKLGWLDEDIPESDVLQFLCRFAGFTTTVNSEVIDISSKAVCEIFRLKPGGPCADTPVSGWTSTLAPKAMKSGDSYVVDTLPQVLRERVAFLKATIHVVPEMSHAASTIVRQAEQPDASWDWGPSFALRLMTRWKSSSLGLKLGRAVYSTSHIRIILKHYRSHLLGLSVHRRVSAVSTDVLKDIPQEIPTNEGMLAKKKRKGGDSVLEEPPTDEVSAGTHAAGDGGEMENEVQAAMRCYREIASGLGPEAALVAAMGRDTRKVINTYLQAYFVNSMSPEDRAAAERKCVQLRQELADRKALLKTRLEARSKSGSVAVRSSPSKIDDAQAQTESQSIPAAEQNVALLFGSTEGRAASAEKELKKLEQQKAAGAQHEQRLAQERYGMERRDTEIAGAKEDYEKVEEKMKELQSELARKTAQLGQVEAQLLRSRQTVTGGGFGTNATIAQIESYETRIRELETDVEIRKKRELKLNSDLAEADIKLAEADSKLAASSSRLADANVKIGDLSKLVNAETTLKIQLEKVQQELSTATRRNRELMAEKQEQAAQLRENADVAERLRLSEKYRNEADKENERLVEESLSFRTIIKSQEKTIAEFDGRPSELGSRSREPDSAGGRGETGRGGGGKRNSRPLGGRRHS